mmetsp:Transcript_49/g.72  ORF Transcript_49/g.72 Transcript_49/m.72 type:complete len:422 (-) Transcript_49:1295-2560(-)
MRLAPIPSGNNDDAFERSFKSHLLFDIYYNFGGIHGIDGSRQDLSKMMDINAWFYGKAGDKFNWRRKSQNLVNKWKKWTPDKLVLQKLKLESLPFVTQRSLEFVCSICNSSAAHCLSSLYASFYGTDNCAESKENSNSMVKFSLGAKASKDTSSDEAPNEYVDPRKPSFQTIETPNYPTGALRLKPVNIDKEYWTNGVIEVKKVEVFLGLEGNCSFTGGLIVLDSQLLKMIENSYDLSMYRCTIEDPYTIVLRIPALSHNLQKHRDQLIEHTPTQTLSAYDAAYGEANDKNLHYVDWVFKFPYEVSVKHIVTNTKNETILPVAARPIFATTTEADISTNVCFLEWSFVRPGTMKTVGPIEEPGMNPAVADMYAKSPRLGRSSSSVGSTASTAGPDQFFATDDGSRRPAVIPEDANMAYAGL